MKLLALFTIVASFTFGSFFSIKAQKSTDENLDGILDKVDGQVDLYIQTFRDLSSVQTKHTEVFNRSGKLVRQRTLVSDMIVVGSRSSEPAEGNGLQEFFVVRSVNGKPVKGADKRSLEFFLKLEREQDRQKVSERLQKESLRYDRDIKVYGSTLGQTVVLSAKFRSNFDFSMHADQETFPNDVIVIRYTQTSRHPDLAFDIQAPASLEIKDVFFRGEIWVDRRSFQIVHILNEVFFTTPQFHESFVVIRQQNEYVSSDLGISVPKKIVLETFTPNTGSRRQISKSDGKITVESTLSGRLTMTYSEFRKFDISVQSEQ
jgi:hypothetical protein